MPFSTPGMFGGKTEFGETCMLFFTTGMFGGKRNLAKLACLFSHLECLEKYHICPGSWKVCEFHNCQLISAVRDSERKWEARQWTVKGNYQIYYGKPLRDLVTENNTPQGWSIKPWGQWSIIWQCEGVQIVYLGSNLIWENGLSLGDVWEFCIYNSVCISPVKAGQLVRRKVGLDVSIFLLY